MFANYAVFYTILQYICDIYMYHKASLKKIEVFWKLIQ